MDKKRKMSEEELKWQTEDDIRILCRAEELEAELAKDPARKKRMVDMAKERMTAMASIASEKD